MSLEGKLVKLLRAVLSEDDSVPVFPIAGDAPTRPHCVFHVIYEEPEFTGNNTDNLWMARVQINLYLGKSTETKPSTAKFHLMSALLETLNRAAPDDPTGLSTLGGRSINAVVAAPARTSTAVLEGQYVTFGDDEYVARESFQSALPVYLPVEGKDERLTLTFPVGTEAATIRVRLVRDDDKGAGPPLVPPTVEWDSGTLTITLGPTTTIENVTKVLDDDASIPVTHARGGALATDNLRLANGNGGVVEGERESVPPAPLNNWLRDTTKIVEMVRDDVLDTLLARASADQRQLDFDIWYTRVTA